MRIALLVLAAASLAPLAGLASGCDRKESSAGSCPAAYPAAKACSTAHQECPYEVEAKKMKCTCEPDTAGPSTWQCVAE